jgi:hypothetical protein
MQNEWEVENLELDAMGSLLRRGYPMDFQLTCADVL